jgi:DNA-binding CsgD family transcriptional regulator
MHLRREPSRRFDEILLQILDDLLLAVFLLTPQLQVVEKNAAASELVAQNDGVGIHNGRLRLSCGSGQNELGGIVTELMRGGDEARLCSWSMVIGRTNGPPLHLCARIVRQGGDPLIVLYAIDPLQQMAVDSELLRSAYRLTRAEVRIATELANGHSVESMAELLGISVHTVRTHLKSLFAKTGTSRQGELIRLVSGSLGGLRVTRTRAHQGTSPREIEEPC